MQIDRFDKEQRQNVIFKIVKIILGSAICEKRVFRFRLFYKLIREKNHREFGDNSWLEIPIKSLQDTLSL